MSPTIWWMLVALVLGGAELLLGTFYLLILAVGAAAAALAAWLGATLTWQIVVAGAVSVLGWLMLRGRRERGGGAADDGTLDTGATVAVAAWDTARETTVRYRGAPWRAELAADVATPAPIGNYRIVRVDGTRLIIAPAAPSP